LTAVAAEFGSPPLIEAESRTDSATLWVILRDLLERTDGAFETEDRANGTVAATTGPDAPAFAWTSHTFTHAGADDGWPAGRMAVADRPGEILRRVASAVLRHSPDARLNLLLSDGETLWATTVYHSLAALIGEDAVVLASEPYDDDPRWREIPDRRLITARPGSLSVASLELDESERART
ncbi:class II glutamine amidotransferase, partial [Nocardia gipuzkoensis]